LNPRNEAPDNFWTRIFVTATDYRTGLNFWEGRQYAPYSRADLVAEARRVAGELASDGVRKGDVVAIVLDNSAAAVRSLLGCWYLGAAVASLPERVVGTDAESYCTQIESIVDRIRPPLLLCSDRALADIRQSAGVASVVRSFEALGSEQVAIASEPDFPGLHDPAFIQFSSGSTGNPKGCVLSASAIAHQLDMIAEMVDFGPGTVGVNWAPFSHDMGFFGGLMSGLWNDGEGYYSTTARFRLSPRTWLEDLAHYRATYTSASPTALHVAAKVMHIRKKPLPGDLASLRCLMVGAERISWEVVADVQECLGPYGLRADAVRPAYGLAEGTLVVTASANDREPGYCSVDALELAEGHVRFVPESDENSCRIVSCGVPLPGVELDVPEGAGRLASIRFRSPSAATGYYSNREATAARFGADGFVDTGDLGFVHGGELYPVGRADDLICIGGRNVYVNAIESEIEATIEGLRSGSTALIDSTPHAGDRTLVYIAEVGGTNIDGAGIAREIAHTCRRRSALVLDRVVLVPRRTLPRTPSGKIQRHKCRSIVEHSGGAHQIIESISVR